MIPIDKHILYFVGVWNGEIDRTKSAEMIGDGVGSPRRPCFGLVSDDQLGESLRLLNPPEFQVVLPRCEPPTLCWGFARKQMRKLSCTSGFNMFQ